MKIAQVVPIMETVPPKRYGGIERVVQELVLGLSGSGHDISIFGSKGSGFNNPNIRIIESAPFPTIRYLSQNRKWEIHQFLKVLSVQGQFDLIHFHYEPIIARTIIDGLEHNFMEYLQKPFLITFHNTTYIPEHINYYRARRNLWKFNYAFISKNQQMPLSFLPHSSIIYNGIPVERFSFNEKPKDYLMFMGRIMKEKGILEAIAVAKKAGKKLVIAAKIDPVDRVFYERKVKRLIDGKQIVYVGQANFQQKVRYYRNALCLLFPISWNEPFGLVMVEALACGTPVIAFGRGSVPEIVKDGQNGFIVRNIKEMVHGVKNVHKISRKKCREEVVKRFSSDTMVNAYESLYRKILARNKSII